MVINQFLNWVGDAVVSQRVAATAALSRAWLQSDLSLEDRCSAEAALTTLLDDVSPKVRSVMAEIFSTSPHAPLQIVSALSCDQPEVSGYILVRSPLLSDAELIDRVALGGEVAQCFITMRPKLSYAVSAAIAEVGQATACAGLVRNTGAEIADITFRRLAERWGQNGEIRLALLARIELPADCRHLLAIKLGEVLAGMQLVRAAVGAERANQVTREACVKASLHLAETCKPQEFPALVEHLRLRGDLTTRFLIRTVAAGQIDFFAAILVALTQLPEQRVLALLADGRNAALGALMRNAGLAENTHQAVIIAIQTWRKVANGQLSAGPQAVSKLMLDGIETGRATRYAAANDDLVALLRSIHLEMTRDNARAHAKLIAAA